MTDHWTPATVALALLLTVAAALATCESLLCTRGHRLLRGRKYKLGTLVSLLLVALSACSSGRAVNPNEARGLAGSNEAMKVRQQEEKRLRDVAQAYTHDMPLTLALITVSDTCKVGLKNQPFFQSGDDTYKIKCSMGVTAYYGADPKHMGDILDSILSAGDRPGSPIAFRHGQNPNPLVDYYRGRGPNPSGSQAPEPTQLSDPSQTLSWDPVRDHTPRLMIEEPEPCMPSDPPVTRCLREPSSATVAGIRKQYGMVFKLSLGSGDYYKVFKSGQTSTK
ncbi:MULTISPECIES: hypothetical protein [unclassified Streptomyces]|uniref:hypothetical protein n=1 Tax=unclassified Streptomyces TaxID=2593676 RepID=UPI0037F50BC9